MRRILMCRTEKLGGHAWECKKCKHTKIAYYSCKNRSCPQCGWVGVEEWIVKTTPKILERDHFHMIFSIPEELNVLWIKNTKLMIHLLFMSVRQTLEKFQKQELGLKLGVMMNLHTWSRTLNLHPHIHCLITAGGVDKKGNWHDTGEFLFPILGVSKYFRTRFLMLIREHANELINFDEVNAIIHPLFNKKWNVFISKKYSHGRGVMKYLACYVKGGPIKNERILAYDGIHVTFRYKDHRDNQKKVMTLTVDEFIRRFIMHFVPKRQRVLRFLGIYATRKNYKAPSPDGDNPIARSFLTLKPVACPYCKTSMLVHPNLKGSALLAYKPPDEKLAA